MATRPDDAPDDAPDDFKVFWPRVTLSDVSRNPCELLAPPSYLIGSDRASASRAKSAMPPLAPRASGRPPQRLLTEKAARKKKHCSVAPRAENLECNRQALDSCADHPARFGRCRYRYGDDAIVALPLSPHRLCSGFHDELHELVVVEMRGPAGDISWLDDDRVTHVSVQCADETFLLLRKTVRAFVSRKVPYSSPTRSLARASMYKLCAPLEEVNSMLLVALIPARDLVTACASQPPTGNGGADTSVSL